MELKKDMDIFCTDEKQNFVEVGEFDEPVLSGGNLKNGKKVYFLGRNGCSEELEEAEKMFVVGQILTVKEIYYYINSRSGVTEINFEEFEGRWNAVMFGDCKEKKEIPLDVKEDDIMASEIDGLQDIIQSITNDRYNLEKENNLLRNENRTMKISCDVIAEKVVKIENAYDILMEKYFELRIERGDSHGE